MPVTAAGVACRHTPGVTCGAGHSTAVTNQLTRSTAASYVRRLRDQCYVFATFCWMLTAVAASSRSAFWTTQGQSICRKKKQYKDRVSITGCFTLIITFMSYWLLLQVIWSLFMCKCCPFNEHSFATLWNPRVWGLYWPKALCHTAAQKKHRSDSTASQNPRYFQDLHNTNPQLGEIIYVRLKFIKTVRQLMLSLALRLDWLGKAQLLDAPCGIMHIRTSFSLLQLWNTVANTYQVKSHRGEGST